MKRVIIFMLDSVGIGASPDAEDFGDQGSNTLGHIAKACANGDCENRGGDYGDSLKNGVLKLPNLESLGLGYAAEKACGKYPFDKSNTPELKGAYAYATEVSSGKDTPSGHWEMAGSPVLFDWSYFPNVANCFPKDLIDKILKRANLPGMLGNCYASGTTIISELGQKHIKTKLPIFYTSADSVFQIACHEDAFGLDNLYKLCEITREELDKVEGLTIGRVIARPFIGDNVDNFKRTGNRKDYAIEPPYETVLKKMEDSGGEVVSVGKISDIYAHIGITKKVKASGLNDLWESTLKVLSSTENNDKDSIIFTNFVDFDSEYGHRRNISGYAAALEHFDSKLPEVFPLLKEGDLLLITADHGNDPSWPGTEHTRELVPVLWYGKGVQSGLFLGQRESFADMGQTIANYLSLPQLEFGKKMLDN